MPPALGVEIVPVSPVVCLVRLVPSVNELTEDGLAKYIARVAVVVVEGTNHT